MLLNSDKNKSATWIRRIFHQRSGKVTGNRLYCAILFFSSMSIFCYPALQNAWSQMVMPPIYHVLLSSIDTNQKVFIIGDSTVHRHVTDYFINNLNMNCGDDNTEPPVLAGWGDMLGLYMEHPENTTNNARQGASSEEYRSPPATADVGVERNWTVTKQMIEEAEGGIVLIQFGSAGNENRLASKQDYDNDGDIDNNDEILRRQIRDTKFKQNLEGYISEVRALNALPILVTPPEGRLDSAGSHADGSHPQTRIPFPAYIKEIGSATGTAVLDLTAKSNAEFAKYSDAVLLREFGDCRYNTGYVDRVHYEPQGAEKVAGWVKELACEQSGARALCAQFSTTIDRIIPEITLKGDYYYNLPPGEQFNDPGATAIDDRSGNLTADIVVTGSVNSNEVGEYVITYDVQDASANQAIQVTRIVNVNAGVTVRENAEDGDENDWVNYTGNGQITNVFDNERNSRVIQLNGPHGLDDGFRYPSGVDWNEASETVISWKMKYSENFTFFVTATTTEGNRIFVYQPTENGMEITHDGARYRFSLGADVINGQWHTFNRDLVADMNALDPDNAFGHIVRIAIRGSGFVDDITTAVRGSNATFGFNGHSYEIVKTASTWQAASDAAVAKGGYLANIGSIAENHEIYSRLFRYVAPNEYGNTVSNNGGGASYVWIGANDLAAEGTWIWENTNNQFWNGTLAGNIVGGLYSSWGRSTDQTQHEPDNYNNSQDAAGIALTEWPLNSGSLGQTSQWNDLNATDNLFYIIEYE